MAVIIDRTKCNGTELCPKGGICVEICALNAMSDVDGKPQVDEDACPECGLCVMNCPNEAISKSQ